MLRSRRGVTKSRYMFEKDEILWLIYVDNINIFFNKYVYVYNNFNDKLFFNAYNIYCIPFYIIIIIIITTNKLNNSK